MRTGIFVAVVIVALGLSGEVASAKTIQKTAITVDGQTYYLVNGNDPKRDTGDEVCALAGQKCVGYTATDIKVCLAEHPTAKSQTGVDGSKSPFYCNGEPQGGVCANEKNTCRICPTCNVGVTCAEPIGSLYTQMYVQCDGPSIVKPPMWKSVFAVPGRWWSSMRNTVGLSFDRFREILDRLQNVTVVKRVTVQVEGPNGTESADVPADSYVCEFYQQNKKMVTCGALGAADQFCVTAFDSRFARAELCQDNGVIVCSKPCTTNPQELAPQRCAFDADRPRGNQAPPLNFCNETKTIKVDMNMGTKRAGQECNHGGDCQTGICLGVVDSGPRKNLCSCSQTRHDTSCNK